MAASRVNIEADAWTDLRFAALAQLLGLPGGHDHALILCAKIWSWQTAHYAPDAPTYVVDRALADGVLGQDGAAALVSARLADEDPNGIRIRGSEGRIEWLYRLTQNGKKSKPNRKQVAPAAAPAPAPAGHLPRPLSSLVHPESETPAPARARALPPGPGRTPSADPGELDDAARAARRAIVRRLWSELDAARGEVAAELAIADVRPLPPVGDPGERALAMRLVEAGDARLSEVEADARHVIAVARAEALSPRVRSVQWLTGALFEDRSWRRALGMTPTDAARIGPKRATAGPSNVGRVEPHEPSAYGSGDQKL